MSESFSAAHSAVKIAFFVSSLTLASLGARLATADSSPTAEGTALGVAVARQIGGDLSDASLKRLIDAEAGAVFARHDPFGLNRPKPGALELFESGPRPKMDLSPAAAAAVNDAVPFSTDPNPPARPFVFRGSAADREAATTCLTQAVYYEAGFEPVDGAKAVAQVVLNRVRHPIFPHTVCGVVFQGADLRTGCQFSFTCDGSMQKPPAPLAYARARKIAEAALGGAVFKPAGQATHYHTQFVFPWWAPTVTKVAKAGSQIFYRWPGALGLPPAFNGRYAGGEPSRPTLLAQAAQSALAAAAAAPAPVEEPVHAVLNVAAAQIAPTSAPAITRPATPAMEAAALQTDAPDLKVRAPPPAVVAGSAFYSCSAGPCRRW